MERIGQRRRKAPCGRSEREQITQMSGGVVMDYGSDDEH